MQRLSELQARLHSLGELGGVVRALRSVSAARVQQAHGVLDSIRQYTSVIQDALTDASRGLPLPPNPGDSGERGGFIIVFGSEHGFVGAFNERLFKAATREHKPTDETLIVGTEHAESELAAIVPTLRSAIERKEGDLEDGADFFDGTHCRSFRRLGE